MLAFRFHQTLFAHVIAAQNAYDAGSIALANVIPKDGTRSALVEQWHTPDVWTRRAVDMALAPKIIDTIPRFVVDRKDGPVYLDIDDVPDKLSDGEVLKCGADSLVHYAWLESLQFDHSYSDELRRHVAVIAKISGTPMHAIAIRALAGAWGLGPIPEWHAAILPALIALDIETTDTINAFGDNVFELDIVELCYELKRCYDLSEHVPAWCKEAIRQTLNCLAGQPSIKEIRATCLNVLKLVNWIQ